MKSREFEEKIKELGYEYNCDTQEIEDGIIVEYARTEEGQTLLCISNSYEFDIDTAWGAFESMELEKQDELFYLFYLYARTPIHERGLRINKKEVKNYEFSIDRD